MKRLIKSSIKATLLLPVFLLATGTDYYITIDNQTPWALKYVSSSLFRGSFDSSGFDASVAANSKSQAIRINAKNQKGGKDTRIDGSVTYQADEFPQYRASASFNMDYYAGKKHRPYSFGSPSNSSDNLLIVSDSVDNEDSPDKLAIVVKVNGEVLPYRFISLGLGQLNITACGQHATRLAGGYYRNPCKQGAKGDMGYYLSIGFANSPDLCRLTLDSGMEIKDSSLSCNMGTEARYVKDKAAIVFICQSKGYGTSSCPWVTVGTDSVSTLLEGTF